MTPQFWLAGVCVILVCLMRFHGADWKAILALACLTVSIGFFNLWTFVEMPADDATYQAYLSALKEADPDLYKKEIEIGLPEKRMDALTWAYDMWAFGLNAVLVMYVAVVALFLWKPENTSVMAKLLWTVVAGAEAYSLVFENFNCNILNRGMPGYQLSQVWGTEVSIYACARNYGEWIVWAPTLIEVGFLCWIVWRYTERQPDHQEL